MMLRRAAIAVLTGRPHLQQFHQAPQTESFLLRDYIQRSLYDPVQGYFLRTDIPVGFLKNPINFHKVVNETEYKLLLKDLYQKLQVSWLTPVELFKPWYGYAIAKYLLEVNQHAVRSTGSELTIYEVGGGTGTLARTVLDYIKDNAPQLYPSTRYTCIEISRTLAERQMQEVAGEGGHGRQFKVMNKNAWDAAAWGGVRQQHCFVLMTEVLDNLPHDRVERSSTDSPWQQTHAVLQDSTEVRVKAEWGSELQPLADPLITRCLNSGYGVEADVSTAGSSWMQRMIDLASGEGRSSKGDLVRFLPTTCLALMDILHTLRPHHTMIAADFNELPDVCIPGACAPLVSSLVEGVNKDYDSVYVPWGSADIFFPSDFPGLCRLYAESANLAGGSTLTSSSSSIGSGSSSSGGGSSSSSSRGSGGGSGSTTTNAHLGSSESKSLRVSHVSSKEFMYRFADYKQVTTLGGYNPLLEDFSNTSFLLASSLPGLGPQDPKKKKLRKGVWVESQRR